MVRAVSVLVGTIIGAGVFGLPYVIQQSGIFVGIVFLFGITLVTLLLHLAYGEVVLRTPGSHRLVGFAELYLGKRAKVIVSFSTIIGMYAALLAYLILGGLFLKTLLSPLIGDALDATVLGGSLFIASTILIFFGIKMVAVFELIFSFLLACLFLAIILWGSGSFTFENVSLKGEINFPNIFALYGVTLFALAGGVAIPELKEVLAKNQGAMRKVIILGTLIPAILYLLFSFTVVGVSGADTSENAIDGLRPALGRGIVWVGAMFGFMAIVTSMLVIGANLKEIFWYDFKIPHVVSWFLMGSVPLGFFLWGAKDFIGTVALAGSVMGGLDGIFLILMHRAAKLRKESLSPPYVIAIPFFARIILIGVFAAGIVWQVIDLFDEIPFSL